MLYRRSEEKTTMIEFSLVHPTNNGLVSLKTLFPHEKRPHAFTLDASITSHIRSTIYASKKGWAMKVPRLKREEMKISR